MISRYQQHYNEPNWETLPTVDIKESMREQQEKMKAEVKRKADATAAKVHTDSFLESRFSKSKIYKNDLFCCFHAVHFIIFLNHFHFLLT